MKKISCYLTIILLLAAFSNARAQNTAIGIRAGISIPNLTAGGSQQNPLNTGYSSRFGPDAGIFADFQISKLFSLQPMIEYSSQGGKKDGMQALATPPQVAQEYPPGQAPQYLYANYNSTAKLNYLAIPVLAKFGWDFKNSPFRIYVDAGPFVSLLLSAKQVTSGSSQLYTDPSGQQALPGGAQSFNANTDIKDQLHKADLGIEGNLGFAYHCHHGYFFIEGGGNYAFLNIQKGTANGKNNTGAGTVTAGYAFNLGK